MDAKDQLTGAELLRSMCESVYFVQVGWSGPIKIGRAKSVKQRMKALQTGCPEPLRLLRELVVLDAVLVEARLHARFDHLRTRGEWFRPDPYLIQMIREAHGDHLVADEDEDWCGGCDMWLSEEHFTYAASTPDRKLLCDACVREGEPVGLFEPDIASATPPADANFVGQRKLADSA